MNLVRRRRAARSREARSRHQLHHTKVEDFAEWAALEGWWRDPLIGPYERLRLRHESRNRGTVVIFYQRIGAEHLTARGPAGQALVSRWLREKGEVSDV